MYTQDTMTELIDKILVKDQKARDSDVHLYLEVCKTYNPIALQMPFCQVLASLKEYGYPSIETVSRLRRKVQNEKPELRGTEKVQDWRDAKETKAHMGIFV